MACRFLRADDPRVTERFGVHASSCLWGFRSSKRSASPVSSSPLLLFVSAARGTLGVSCFFLRVSARARAPMLNFPLSLWARWRDASAQLHCFDTSA